MMRRLLFAMAMLLAVTVVAPAAVKRPPRKSVPVPLREEPLDPKEASAIADLPFGLCLWNEELFKLAVPHLRKGDHVVVGTSQLALIDRIPEGVFKILFLPRQHGRIETEAYQKAIGSADALSMDDIPSVEEAKWLRQIADRHGKKVMVDPQGEDVPRLGPAMASYADIFVIQSQRWLVEDKSRELQQYCDRLHTAAEKIRQGNPRIQIWVQIGRKLQYGGGNAGMFAHAFTRLRAAHPEDLGHMQLFISKEPDTKPGHGKQALVEFLQAVRPKPSPRR